MPPKRTAYDEWAERLPHVAPQRIGERLEAVREMCGLGKAEFARRAKVTPSHYSNLLAGTNTLPVYHLASFAATYRITMDFIVLGDLSGLPHSIHDDVAARLHTATRKNSSRRTP